MHSLCTLYKNRPCLHPGTCIWQPTSMIHSWSSSTDKQCCKWTAHQNVEFEMHCHLEKKKSFNLYAIQSFIHAWKHACTTHPVIFPSPYRCGTRGRRCFGRELIKATDLLTAASLCRMTLVGMRRHTCRRLLVLVQRQVSGREMDAWWVYCPCAVSFSSRQCSQPQDWSDQSIAVNS